MPYHKQHWQLFFAGHHFEGPAEERLDDLSSRFAEGLRVAGFTVASRGVNADTEPIATAEQVAQPLESADVSVEVETDPGPTLEELEGVLSERDDEIDALRKRIDELQDKPTQQEETSPGPG